MIETVDVANIVQGDTVRVVLEGVVAAVHQPGRFILGSNPDRNLIESTAVHVISVEKLAKPLAVGDVLTAEQYAAVGWEQGTVLLDLPEVDVLLLAFDGDDRGQSRWLSSRGGNWWGISELARYISSVKVLHLPEAKDA